ncbi:MAG: cation:proton antiporter [Acidimicrobiales bacterium]
MSVTQVLLDILIVLLSAKGAAELAERAHVPAVVGEILAGILIGPSVLGLVEVGDVLRVLSELGVILLLLDVGMEMDLAELAAVGRASLTVATIGVAVPFVGGWATAAAFGMGGNEAIFVGAALTATSVGITARVFGDLRALGTVEARTVLGAAVADDVMGLVVLTVVVRLASEGSVSALSVAGIVGVAVAFLVVTSVLGVRIAPRLFEVVARHSRSSGTLVAVALAFTLGVAELASAAKLAPIVGAFVAGISLGRSDAAERIRRELTPVGHLLIPVFFLQIGIEAQVEKFFDPAVLGLAGALLTVAVTGKLAASAGLLGSPGDRLLVGIGMIPRGEVGLIFATLGLRQHIVGPDVYAAVLLVVLVTTLLTPPALRWRLVSMGKARGVVGPAVARPETGWLAILPRPAGGTLELVADPPITEALALALEAALRCGEHRPGPKLLDWLNRLPDTPLQWDRVAKGHLFDLLKSGGSRSWRFLALTGILDRALPELGQALSERQADPHELDPISALRWPRLARLQELGDWQQLANPERLLLAAVILDATEGDLSAEAVARRVVARLDLGAAVEQAVAGLVRDVRLLPAASRRLVQDEEAVLQLAVHVRSADQARAMLMLAQSDDDLEVWERERLRELHERLQAALSRPELTGREAANLVERRRATAARLSQDAAVRERIAAAPRAYVLATAPPDLARHAAWCEPPPTGDQVRVWVGPESDGQWRIDIVARDRIGLLATETQVLGEAGLKIVDATIATWGDGCALASFHASGDATPDDSGLAAALRSKVAGPLSTFPLPDAGIVFDDEGSPWHTICRVEVRDRPGLLHAITLAFSSAGASVHLARITTVGDMALDTFELTDRDGAKLGQAAESLIRSNLVTGVTSRRRRWLPWRRALAAMPPHDGATGDHNGSRESTEPKHYRDSPETTAL